MSHVWMAKNQVIVIAVLSAFVNFAYYAFHNKSSAICVKYSLFGFLTCVVLALGACLKKKYKYTFWPFIAYNAFDSYVNGWSLLAMIYVLNSKNTEYLRSIWCENARCYTDDIDYKTNVIPMVILNMLYLALLFGLNVVAGFIVQYEYDYGNAFPKSAETLPPQIAEMPLENSNPKQQSKKPENEKEGNIELGNKEQD